MNLFGEIATKSKKINASFEVNNVIPDLELQKHGNDTVMMINEPLDRIDQGAGIRTDKQISFEIVKYRNTKQPNIPQARVIKEECLQIVQHVLSYIRNQQRSGQMTDVFVDGAELNPMDYFSLDWHGYRCSLSLRTPVNLAYDPDDWNE